MSTNAWLLKTILAATECAEEVALQWLQAAQQGDSKMECAKAEAAYKEAKAEADRARMAALDL